MRLLIENNIINTEYFSQKSSQFQYAKDSLDQIVKEYCSGGLFPRKPETFLFIDEKLTALVNTLYGNFTVNFRLILPLNTANRSEPTSF